MRSRLGAGSPIARRRTRRPSARAGGSRHSMARFRPAPGQLTRGDGVEQVVVVGRQATEAGQRLDCCRVDPLHGRDDLVADAIAARVEPLVCRVQAIADPGRVEGCAQGGTARCDQRPHHAPSSGRDAADPRQAAAAHHVEEDRLRGVIGGVGRGDERVGRCHFLEESVACLASGLLQGPSFGCRQGGYIGPSDGAGEVEGGGGIGNEGRVVVRVGPEPMVKVRDGELPPAEARGAVEERHRVRPSGDREEE